MPGYSQHAAQGSVCCVVVVVVGAVAYRAGLTLGVVRVAGSVEAVSEHLDSAGEHSSIAIASQPR